MPRAEPAASVAEIERRIEAAGLEVGPREAAALARFLELLTRWNRVYNLTGLRDLDLLIERHLVESLALRPLLRGEAIADVGTGAGLPGLPLAITERGRRFTLIESRAKRVRFLRQVVSDLGLANTAIEHGRAEHLRPDSPFATVLARAVAPPAELLAICRHLTAPGSVLVLLTSRELQHAFDGLAADFAPRPEAAARVVVKGLKSSIVVLQRVPVDQADV
jgi:16S rRNA (guanine527-N7)-methyltransferase